MHLPHEKLWRTTSTLALYSLFIFSTPDVPEIPPRIVFSSHEASRSRPFLRIYEPGIFFISSRGLRDEAYDSFDLCSAAFARRFIVSRDSAESRVRYPITKGLLINAARQPDVWPYGRRRIVTTCDSHRTHQKTRLVIQEIKHIFSIKQNRFRSFRFGAFVFYIYFWTVTDVRTA